VTRKVAILEDTSPHVGLQASEFLLENIHLEPQFIRFILHMEEKVEEMEVSLMGAWGKENGRTSRC